MKFPVKWGWIVLFHGLVKPKKPRHGEGDFTLRSQCLAARSTQAEPPMPITLNDLTINFDGIDRTKLLEDWDWAMPEPITPILITAMGDVFAQAESGTVYFLDAECGTIESIAASVDEFRRLLTDAAFVTDRMYPSRIVQLRKANLTLGTHEVYGNKHPLVLGGADTLENIETANVVVHLSLLGQIHKQVKDLPPGTPINSFKVEGP